MIVDVAPPMEIHGQKAEKIFQLFPRAQAGNGGIALVVVLTPFLFFARRISDPGE
ncbi:MAG: hypothetical protein ACPGRZ_14910 [Alphaproteobacteria bacterium]